MSANMTQERFANYSRLVQFRQHWLALLTECPWADEQHILQSLEEHATIVIPLFMVHYIGDRIDNRLVSELIRF